MRAKKGFIQSWIYCIIDCLTQPFSYPPAALWKKHGSGSQWRDDKRLEAQSNWVSTTKDSKHFKEKFCQFSFKSGLKQQKLQHWRQFKQIRPMVQQTNNIPEEVIQRGLNQIHWVSYGNDNSHGVGVPNKDEDLRRFNRIAEQMSCRSSVSMISEKV